MNKKFISQCLIIVGLLAVIAGILWGQYNLWDNQRAGEEAVRVVEAIDRYRPSTAPEAEETTYAPTASDFNALPDYLLNPEMDMPVMEFEGHGYIGTLSVPALDLELPVMEDWSYPQLKIAPCRFAGSAYQGNMILCAHNYAAHFGRLKNLLAGDEVIFTDVDGNVFSYAVVKIEILAPTSIEEMESGEWDLTLFTCTLGGKTRVTVRCNSLEQVS